MARTLLDHNLPKPLKRMLRGHDVKTAAEQGWAKLTNGMLLKAAENAGFDVFVTGDKNLSYQNNLTGRRLSVIVLSEIALPTLKPHASMIAAAIEAAGPGSFLELTVPRIMRSRRAP